MNLPPKYSIVIPAYNEESLLPRTLKSVKSAMSQIQLAGEIIVCDNNSTDRTAAIAGQSGARVVFEKHNQISKARNTGARAGRSEFLVFIDADTQISPELLKAALDRLMSGQCCGGGAVLTMDKKLKPGERFGVQFFNLLSTTYRLAAGCFIFCSREAFESVGGFSENLYASEEIRFSRKMARYGKDHKKPFCIIRTPPVLTSARKMEWYGPVKHGLLITAVVFFPFLLRYRWFCWFWYKRPKQ